MCAGNDNMIKHEYGLKKNAILRKQPGIDLKIL
jgi:hypothetical protein